jgi:hypothetical protein
VTRTRRLGVIMLDTRFERYPGDIGCRDSHRPGTLFETVRDATASRVVLEMALLSDPFRRAEAIKPFIEAGHRLIARGAEAITTSCGFLAAFQQELAAALPRPVMTSTLCLLPGLLAERRAAGPIGVLTFDAASLTEACFAGVGYRGPRVVAGLRRGGAFQRAILKGDAEDSFGRRDRDVAEATRRLVRRAPDLSAVVLECTNLPPHKATIAALVQAPVLDIWSVVARLGARGP